TTTVFAQKSAEEKADRATAKMAKNLDLSDQQMTQIKAIYLEKYEQKAVLKAETKANKAANKAERKEMKENFQARINAVLTDEQLNKQTALKAERKALKAERKALKSQEKAERKAAKKAEKGKYKKRAKLNVMKPDQVESRAQKASDKMTKRLNLTPEQQTQVLAIYQDYYGKNAAINMKTDAVDRATLNAERKEVQQAFNTAINQVLTDEQKAQRKQKRQHRTTDK
ncbi:MAG: hypothetical protein AAF985_02740, partial [Bacteroidota bacterium]